MQIRKTYSSKIFFAWFQQLMFAPAARETKIHLTGNWPDPSFIGIKIPETPNASDSGIDVKWKYLNRTTPMVWNDQFNNAGSAMGLIYLSG
jgi:inner membrane protein